MKPTRNRMMCPDCARPKMLFESEAKAQRFIDFNGQDMEFGDRLRPYYCPACCGWHISHKTYSKYYEGRTDELIEAYHSDTSKKRRTKFERDVLDYEQDAKRIFDSFPQKIQNLSVKAKLRRFITDYFRDNGISDSGGRLRGQLYERWIKASEKLNRNS